MNEDKATRYHRLKRRAEVVALAWGVLLLAGLLWTGLSASLRAASESAASWAPAGLHASVAVVIYVFGLLLVSEIGRIPIALYSGFILERRYGLSNKPSAAG